jgi:hypothetical protein
MIVRIERQKIEIDSTNLPVLGLAGKHLRVLGLTDVTGILILDLLNVLLGADAVILWESTLVASLDNWSAWAFAFSIDGTIVLCGRGPGLDVAASGSRKLADGLEVLVGGPAGREGRQSLVDLRYRHIDVDIE